MPVRGARSTKQPSFVAILVEDGTGRPVDTRKHPGEWTAEDEVRLGQLTAHVARIALTEPPGERTRISLSKIEVDDRVYLVGLGAGLRVGALVRTRTSRRFQKRIMAGLRMIASAEQLRRKTGRPPVGPVSPENLIAWILEGASEG